MTGRSAEDVAESRSTTSLRINARSSRRRRSPGLSAEIVLVLIQGLLVMTTTGADETNLGLVIAAALDQFTYPE